jgi:hypothetical protein
MKGERKERNEMQTNRLDATDYITPHKETNKVTQYPRIPVRMCDM